MRQPETRSPPTVATIARAGRKVLLVYADNIEPLSVLQALLASGARDSLASTGGKL
jgi:hypothetical protein